MGPEHTSHFVEEEALERYAAGLAERLDRLRLRRARLKSKRRACVRTIESSCRKLRRRDDGTDRIPDACRWLLDNEYLARQEALGIRRDLAEAGVLRHHGPQALILELCRELTDCGEGAVDPARIEIIIQRHRNYHVLRILKEISGNIDLDILRRVAPEGDLHEVSRSGIPLYAWDILSAQLGFDYIRLKGILDCREVDTVTPLDPLGVLFISVEKTHSSFSFLYTAFVSTSSTSLAANSSTLIAPSSPTFPERTARVPASSSRSPMTHMYETRSFLASLSL